MKKRMGVKVHLHASLFSESDGGDCLVSLNGHSNSLETHDRCPPGKTLPTLPTIIFTFGSITFVIRKTSFNIK